MVITWPISLRFYLNLEYGSRQIMANQIGPDDHELSLLVRNQEDTRGIPLARCKIVRRTQCSYVLFTEKSSISRPKNGQ